MIQDRTVAEEFEALLVMMADGEAGFIMRPDAGKYQAVGDPAFVRIHIGPKETPFILRVWRGQDREAEENRRHDENEKRQRELAASALETQRRARDPLDTLRGFKLPPADELTRDHDGPTAPVTRAQAMTTLERANRAELLGVLRRLVAELAEEADA